MAATHVRNICTTAPITVYHPNSTVNTTNVYTGNTAIVTDIVSYMKQCQHEHEHVVANHMPNNTVDNISARLVVLS